MLLNKRIIVNDVLISIHNSIEQTFLQLNMIENYIYYYKIFICKSVKIYEKLRSQSDKHQTPSNKNYHSKYFIYLTIKKL